MIRSQNVAFVKGLKIFVCALGVVTAGFIPSGRLADALPAQHDDDSDQILGEWYTPGDRARILIERRDDLYHGRIIWLRDEEETGEVHLDINNPNDDLRDRRIVGLEILRGFRYDGNRYVGGRIYDPESGRTYRARMTPRDEQTLDVRGYVGIALLGRTETFRRVPE